MANLYFFLKSSKQFFYFFINNLFKIKTNRLWGLGMIVTFLSFFFTIQTFAQNVQSPILEGYVYDSYSKQPVIGATVIVEGSTIGTATDANGKFTLRVNQALPVTIKTSYLGYRPEETLVFETKAIQIALKEDANKLKEVVVIGYAQSLKNTVTSAVSTIKIDQIDNVPSASITEKLQGAVPGLLIARNTGAPGASSFIRLRGATSLGGGGPLYIIDGVATTGSSQQIDQSQSADPLAEFNPEDIETITVLKDASATAAYGARGANGVILITTKRGVRNSQTRVNFKAEIGLSKSGKLWELTTGPEHAEIVNEAYKNDGKWDQRPFKPVSEGGIGLPEEQGTYYRVPDVFRTAFQHTYNLSVSGGDAKTNFYIGGDYTFQEATLKLEDFKRYGLRINVDHSITKKLKIGTSNAISVNHRSNVKVGDGPSGFFQASLHTPTFLPVYKEDGSYNSAGAFNNHIAILKNWDGGSKGFRVTNNFYAKYEITDYLSFKSSWSNDRNSGHDTYYYSPLLSQGYPDGAAEDEIGISNLFTTEQTLNYLQSFGKHSVSAYAGYAYVKKTNEDVSVLGRGFASDAFKRVASTATQTGSASGSGSGLVSYFGGANYSYDNRYSIEATVRRDASSQLGANNRAGYFPSIGVSWNPINEAFFPKTDIINDLRLKSSYGIVGNISGGNAHLGLWSGGSTYDGQSGLAPSQLGNPDLKWESTRQWNIGINTSLLKNRLEVELNFYDKFTYDLLLSEALPGKTGFNSVTKNSGEISNKGFEFSLTSLNISNRDFSWRTIFTASRNKNKIVKLPIEQLNASYGSIAREGYPLHSFYLYDYKGVDPETGDAVYDDWTGPDGKPDGKITEADKKIFGNAWPRVEGVFKNTITYKSFALDFSFYYKYKYQVFNYTRSFLESGGTRTLSRSIQKSSINYWKEENKDTYRVNDKGLITDVLPRPKSIKNPDGSTNYEQRSTRNLEDGSFIRLQNVTLSYAFPRTLISRLNIQKASFHITATNLLLISDYTGPDPEVNAGSGIVQGLDFGTPPQPKTILLGLDVTF
ncbi:TonB-dependent receptor [Parabacteroides sp. Marseille-P3160]|uniref:SusC/RagA family TonB-linked outer membrane protein n=1 Tax=Parabacteroides sp. Marseille-P3160 TaxID=1917887 RepID=UPI0009B9539F|nr:TonB-dependent receptor [Parabacteroides sp. Marseille-P3160]